MWTKAFWQAIGERAVKTFAQSLLAVGLVGMTDLLSVDWTAALSAAGAATLLSILSSVAIGAATDGSPSLTGAEVVDPQH